MAALVYAACACERLMALPTGSAGVCCMLMRAVQWCKEIAGATACERLARRMLGKQ